MDNSQTKTDILPGSQAAAPTTQQVANLQPTEHLPGAETLTDANRALTLTNQAQPATGTEPATEPGADTVSENETVTLDSLAEQVADMQRHLYSISGYNYSRR